MCAGVWVLMLDGWRESGGVQAEIDIALRLKKPVMYLEANEHWQGVAGLKAEQEAAE